MTDVVEVSSTHNLDFLLENNPYVVVDFARRNGCVPCKRLEPHYKKVANELSFIVFAVVYLDELDAVEFDKMVLRYNLSATPTVYMFTPESHAQELVERTGPKLVNEITESL